MLSIMLVAWASAAIFPGGGGANMGTRIGKKFIPQKGLVDGPSPFANFHSQKAEQKKVINSSVRFCVPPCTFPGGGQLPLAMRTPMVGG